MATKRTALVSDPVEAFSDFIVRHEQAAQAAGIVAVNVSHPDASEHVYPGIYGGIVVTKGKASATYSDGSKH